MAGRWALGFAVAAGLVLAGSALLERSARSARGRRGEPPSSSGNERLRSLGGVAVVVAALAGWLTGPAFPGWEGTTALGAGALLGAGIIVGQHALPAWTRTATLLAAAAAVAAAGVRAEPTGIDALDLGITLAWIVVVTNGVRRLDRIEGLAIGVMAAATGGIFAVAAFGDQDVVAVMAVSLLGACFGFSAYSRRRASRFLGGAAILPLGFVVAVLTIELDPAIEKPGSVLVPLLLAAVPLLDLGVVLLDQLRRGRELGRSRRHHLSHRLHTLGLSRGAANVVLVAVQLGMSAVAVFAGRGVLPIPWAAAAVGGLAVVVLALALAAPVHRTPARGFSVGLKFGITVLLLGVAGVSAAASWTALDVRDTMNEARRIAERALDSARDGDADAAQVDFGEAAIRFEDARDRLDVLWLRPALAVPVVAPNLAAARDVAQVGLDLSRAGQRLTGKVDQERLRVVDGTVPLDEVERLTPDLEDAAAILDDALQRLDGVDETYLLGPVRDALELLDRELTDADREADNSAVAARLAPAILGRDEPRRYFLAVQNSAEQRATGGLIGNWGILVAENGEVRLEEFERISLLIQASRASDPTLHAPDDYVERYERFSPAVLWQNVNFSPDFPTVGGVISDLYAQVGEGEIDGVIAVDPQGLAALLELTGPIRVEDWPDPITSENVVDVTLRDAYTAFASQPERVDFIGDVAEVAIDTATEGEIGEPAEIARVLGRAAREGHLLLSFVRPAEQVLAEQLQAGGSVSEPESDSVLVTSQNVGRNKLDYYLRRQVGYTVLLTPADSGDRAAVQGRLEVRLENSAPGSGLPQYVIGPAEGSEDLVAGENRMFLSLYTPSRVSGVTLDGDAIGVESGTELGHRVFSADVSVLPQSSRVLSAEVTGEVALEDGGWYEVNLPRQPQLTADDVNVTIEVPRGWRIAEVDGLRRRSSRSAARHLELTAPTSLRVRLVPDQDGRNLWERLNAGT
ncbi:MAG: DUF4012 domain-containing protein [Acidimicrobiia bacterium]